MFNFASAEAFDPLLWSGMLVAGTLLVLGLTTWHERRTRHHQRHERPALHSHRGAASKG